MTNAHSETGQMAVCCQNLMLGALSSHSILSVLVGALFKKFGLFLNMPHNGEVTKLSAEYVLVTYASQLVVMCEVC